MLVAQQFIQHVYNQERERDRWERRVRCNKCYDGER